MTDEDSALERAADLAGVAHFRVDAARRITAWSPAAARLTGYDADEVLGMPCVVGVRCDACLSGCGVQEHGQVRDVPLTLHHKSGAALPIAKSGHAVYDAEGRFTGTVEILTPRAAEAPSPAPSAMDPLLEALGRYGIVADGHFQILRVSEGLARRLGRPASELVKTPLERWLGSDLFGPRAAFRRAVAQGERREGWLAHLVDDAGVRHAVSLSSGPVSPEPGSADRVFVMMRPAEAQAEAEHGDIPKFEAMVGRSAPMQRIFRLIELLHDNDATVLIQGESGTGKELVARALHARSHRAGQPFVAVNCGALPPDLLESELFGHVQGAFTGATRSRPGRFELADRGTLFLDEVGDIPLHLQVKLLRALQERTFERVGDAETRSVDVRVIAATNVDLAEMVAARRFREDLYYRLRVVPIETPPLRERREDLEPLIQHLLLEIGRRRHRSVWLSPAAMRRLLGYGWPGNVRELENALEYATAVCEGQTVHVDDLPVEVRAAPPEEPAAPLSADAPSAPPALPSAPATAADATEPAPRPDEDDQDEAARIQAALEATRHRRSAAAERLGISRTTLWRRMRALGID